MTDENKKNQTALFVALTDAVMQFRRSHGSNSLSVSEVFDVLGAFVGASIAVVDSEFQSDMKAIVIESMEAMLEEITNDEAEPETQELHS